MSGISEMGSWQQKERREKVGMEDYRGDGHETHTGREVNQEGATRISLKLGTCGLCVCCPEWSSFLNLLS